MSRSKLLLFAAFMLVSAAALTLSHRWERGEQPVVSNPGVALAVAGCGDVLEDPAVPAGERATGEVDYPTDPPSTGASSGRPVAVDDSGFFPPGEAPPVEDLVANLELGWTVLWYDPELSSDQRASLEAIARHGRTQPLVAVPWDGERGALPPRITLAITHWGEDAGYRQYCERVSYDAIAEFARDHPPADRPERPEA